MGANTFGQMGHGKTAEEAFINAKEEAYYEHGHGGYSGSLAEKGSFIMIELPQGQEAYSYADDLIDKSDNRIDDKWGPAGCIKVEEGKYLFFGWASA